MADFNTGLSLDIPIFVKTYELYKAFYKYLPNFPKKDRYTLGQRCEATLLDLLESIILAGNLSRHDKHSTLKQASIKVDLLKVLFRLLKDLRIIDVKKYLILEESLQEIGRMLGGWIKTTDQA
jgi:hypothetical protein